jgi:hypothetical protein
MLEISIAEPGALVVLLDLGLLDTTEKIYLKVFKHQVHFFGFLDFITAKNERQNKTYIDLIKIDVR